jgi:hypothetical protein
LGNCTEFVIPFPSEATNEWPLKKFVKRQLKFASFFHSILTDRPTMIVQCHSAISETLLTDRIERTAKGLAK